MASTGVPAWIGTHRGSRGVTASLDRAWEASVCTLLPVGSWFTYLHDLIASITLFSKSQRKSFFFNGGHSENIAKFLKDDR